MSTPVVSIPPEQRANLTTAEWMAEHDERARLSVALAESERKRVALAAVATVAAALGDHAATLISDDESASEAQRQAAEDLATLAMEARRTLADNARSSEGGDK